jgi:hypothetical protein
VWIELKDDAGARLLVNLDLTFAFHEQPGGQVNAVSINGVGVPTGETYETVRDNIHQAEG